MDSTKKKNEIVEKSQKKKGQDIFTKGDSQTGESIDPAIMKQWDSAIEDLQSQNFNTIEEAVDALLCKVLENLNVIDSKDEIKTFLETMIESDPIVKDKIKNILL